MKIGNKPAIASIRNKGGKRVFIPERMRIDGVRYVQPYTLSRITPSVHPFIFSMTPRSTLVIEILYNEVVLIAPFTTGLLKQYLDKVQVVIERYPGRTYKIQQDEKKRANEWDMKFMRGKGEFVVT